MQQSTHILIDALMLLSIYYAIFRFLQTIYLFHAKLSVSFYEHEHVVDLLAEDLEPAPQTR